MANYNYQGDIRNPDAARLSPIDLRPSRLFSDGTDYDSTMRWKQMVAEEIIRLRSDGVAVSSMHLRH